tara:strand:- start:466 stop:807 length:342 start_codon:yes stop_codon:yes gene_type:complete
MVDYFGLAASKSADKLASRYSDFQKAQIISYENLEAQDKNLPQKLVQNMSENMVASNTKVPMEGEDPIVHMATPTNVNRDSATPSHIVEPVQKIAFAERYNKPRLAAKTRKIY